MDDCIIWTGSRKNGYGFREFGGRRMYAHRVAYWQRYGVLPQVLHHVCCNPLCVNPEHLQATTFRTHPDGAPVHQKTKTHCPHGHLLDGVVVLSNGTSRRTCKTCKRMEQSARYHRQRKEAMT